MNLKDKLVVISLQFESFLGVSCTTGSLIRVLNNIWTKVSRKPWPEPELFTKAQLTVLLGLSQVKLS